MLGVVLVNGTIVNKINSVNRKKLIFSTLSVLYKNERQMEFSRLMERLGVKGFRPADAARLLKVSKASVSKILSGEQTPREPTLDSFRRIVAEQCGENPPPVPPGPRENRLLDRIAFLKENDPASHAVIEQVAGALYDKAVSSARLSAETETALSHAAAARKLAQVSERRGPVDDLRQPGFVREPPGCWSPG
jgi:transcriptional regulator with XRE-family HTH domain